MSKEINEYLAFYIGRPVEYGYEDTKKIGKLIGKVMPWGWQVEQSDRHKPPLNVTGDLVKPILRSLEDITEQECEEYNRIHNMCHSINKLQDQIRTDAHATQYLLSRGFDLFGLITQGLALDESKIKTQST